PARRPARGRPIERAATSGSTRSLASSRGCLRLGRRWGWPAVIGVVIEASCWAHARRKFFDLARINKAPIAIEAVERIDALSRSSARSTASRRRSARERATSAVARFGLGQGLVGHRGPLLD